jgi:hypothetical protein
MDEKQTLFGYDHLTDLVRELRGFFGSEMSRMFIKLESLERRLMSTADKILGAVQTNGIVIAETSNALLESSARIQELVEQVLASGGESPQLTEALSLIQSQGSQLAQLKDTALQLVPTIPSPTKPTDPGAPIEPIPAPEPLPEAGGDAGDVAGDVVVAPSDDTIGLPGSVEIDLPTL